MGYLWMGIGISFFVLAIIITFSIGWFNAWPFFIFFYAMGTFISGKLYNFTPSIVGGIIAGYWHQSQFLQYDYQLLIAAAAILCSYIVPGYMIKPEKTNTDGRQTTE